MLLAQIKSNYSSAADSSSDDEEAVKEEKSSKKTKAGKREEEQGSFLVNVHVHGRLQIGLFLSFASSQMICVSPPRARRFRGLRIRCGSEEERQTPQAAAS